MQVSAQPQRAAQGLRNTQSVAERDRVRRQPLAVPRGIGVARLDGGPERDDDGLGALQMVEQRLHAQQHADPRAQLRELERLAEEIVGTGGEAGHPRAQIGHRGHDDDRGQREARVGLQTPAELDPADAAHVNVGEDQIGCHDLDVDQGRLGGGGGPHEIPEVRELIAQHVAHVGLVVDHEDHAAAVGH